MKFRASSCNLTESKNMPNQKSKRTSLRKLLSQGLLVLALVVGSGLIAIASGYAKTNTTVTSQASPTIIASHDNQPPTIQQIDFAKETSDLMLATLFAALTQEFDETTPANVKQGSHSISLIFNDLNRDMRLVGTVGPLSPNDLPSDRFERRANNLAVTTGEAYTSVQRLGDTWYYRRSVPLSNFRAECALCHTNYPPGPTADKVGALMLRVPIKQ
jgi:hypothetical protein